MRTQLRFFSILLFLAVTMLVRYSVAIAQDLGEGSVAQVNIGSSSITWESKVSNDGMVLKISGPNDFYFEQEYGVGKNPSFRFSDKANGSYTYELKTIPTISKQVKEALASVTEENRYAVEKQLREAGKLPESQSQSGAFFISNGAVVNNDADEVDPNKDIQHLDDVIANFSLCVGTDCVNGENFGFDTIRLKENNLRIHFDDTSNSGSFPANDWRITVNDSINGGESKFTIDDATAGRTPFTIRAGAPSNSLYIDSAGDVGMGTSNPVVNAHAVDGNTPTVRLEQDGSSGFTPQTWDVAGNEANFFIRDVTNGSKLSFRIRPGAPESSIDIQNDGGIHFNGSGNFGFGTTTPQRKMHIIGSDGKVSSFPSSLGGKDAFIVENNGNVNIGLITGSTGASALKFYRDGAAGFVGYINYDNTKKTMDFYVEDNGSLMQLNSSGDLSLSGALSQNSDINAKMDIIPVDNQEVLVRLVEIPVSTWSYKDDGADIRHMGPMAQDFYAAFELGQDDRHISPLDTSGATLAAVQALYELSQEKDAQIAELEQQNEALEARLEALEAIVSELANE
ncbi:MAG: tail fiber domain-containing protein [Anaerolineae bacterium]|nr:tail fiber domain-containing protein [Anaerolineae bacterium]